jgi:hypothetical protein
VWVITDFGAFLFTVQRLDDCITIQYLRLAQYECANVLQTGLQPAHASFLVQLSKSASDRILTDRFVHAQQFGIIEGAKPPPLPFNVFS